MRTWIVVLIGVFAFGCSKDEPQMQGARESPQPGITAGAEVPRPAAAMASSCPMQVQGTSVQHQNVAGGAALVFTTGGNVESLRERVRSMAVMHESHAMLAESRRMGLNQTARPGSADDPAAGAKSRDARESIPSGETDPARGPAPAIDTRVENIEGGARLLVIAADPTDLEAVRASTESYAEKLVAGECPMAPQAEY
jgi:hypothetical protein